jgi:hypothetical protein
LDVIYGMFKNIFKWSETRYSHWRTIRPTCHVYRRTVCPALPEAMDMLRAEGFDVGEGLETWTERRNRLV